MTFSEIKIERFRGIKTCTLTDLGMVNLFFGRNNCGKSTLLEGLMLISSPSNPSLPFTLNSLRNLASFDEEDIKANFYLTDTEKPIYLKGRGALSRDVYITMLQSHTSSISLEELKMTDSKQPCKRYGLQIEFYNGNSDEKYYSRLTVDNDKTGATSYTTSYKESLHAEYIPSGYMQIGINSKLANIITNKQESEILSALRILEPRIKDIQLVGKRIMIDMGLPTRLPINLLGDGVRKVLSIIVSIYNAANGVLLVDEIDNGLHYSVMPKFWEVVLTTCKKTNTQMFISTHSMDMVKALVHSLKALDDNAPKVSAYKLIKKEDDELVALLYDREHLSYTVEQEMEIR